MTDFSNLSGTHNNTFTTEIQSSLGAAVPSPNTDSLRSVSESNCAKRPSSSSQSWPRYDPWIWLCKSDGQIRVFFVLRPSSIFKTGRVCRFGAQSNVTDGKKKKKGSVTREKKKNRCLVRLSTIVNAEVIYVFAVEGGFLNLSIITFSVNPDWWLQILARCETGWLRL